MLMSGCEGVDTCACLGSSSVFAYLCYLAVYLSAAAATTLSSRIVGVRKAVIASVHVEGSYLTPCCVVL